MQIHVDTVLLYGWYVWGALKELALKSCGNLMAPQSGLNVGFYWFGACPLPKLQRTSINFNGSDMSFFFRWKFDWFKTLGLSGSFSNTINIIYRYTSSTAQGGGGSFKNRRPIGEVGCCESGIAERSHWWTEMSSCLPVYLSIYLSICLSVYLSICGAVSFSVM